MVHEMKKTLVLSLASLFFCVPTISVAQRMTKPTARIHHIATEIPVTELYNVIWKSASEIKVGTYWNGAEAPIGRRFVAQMLWSDSALYVRFEATQAEPLVVSDKPELKKKTMRLWERDVCELFLTPDKNEPRHYAEFEIAPTGEWLDLVVDWRNKEPRDWEYRSGMEPAAKIEKDKVTTAFKIPWKAFGGKPSAGDVWLGNLYRAVGAGETRGYLAWSPTMTNEPQFHVPERFGEFVFAK